MSRYSRFYAETHVGDRVRVWRDRVDLGEAVVVALANPATDMIIRFRYLNDRFANPYDSVNVFRKGYTLKHLLTPLPNPMDPRS